MAGPTKSFRVPCRCSATVEVGPGHAGSEVLCPACGGPVEVPRLRDLAAFAVGETPPSARNWQASHGVVLVGSCVAVVAGLTAAVVSRFDGGAASRLPDELMIRAAIEAADPATIHAAWRSMVHSSVDRGAIPEELEVQRLAGSLGRLAALAWGLAAAGGVAAVGGGLFRLGAGSATGREGQR